MSRTRLPSWLKSYLSRYKRDVAFALALGLAASGCAALLMFTAGYLISATALATTTLFAVMTPVACVQLFGFGRPAARYLERLASHNWVLKVTSDLRLSLYRAIERRTGDPARERATGEYLGLLADDVAHLQNLYLRVVFPTAVAYLLVIGAAALFGFFSIPFALVMLAAFALVATALPFASLLACRALSEREKELRAEEHVRLSDDVSGSLDWVLSGRSARAVSDHAAANGELRALGAQMRTRQRALSLASALLMGALACLVLAWAGGSFGGSERTVNWIAAFALGFFPLIEALTVLPAALAESSAHETAVRRLDEYLGEPGGHGGGEAVEPDLDQHELSTHSAQAGRALALDDVTYAYPGSPRPALEGLSLAFERGSSTAILGRSGSGKTTLARLACGELAPDSGGVFVEGAPPTPDGSSPACAVGYLGQEPYLFNRTLRENLLLGGAERSDDDLAALLSSVGLGKACEALPHGLDTVIGETGVGLSGGEAHRVALARVLAAGAPVVVVDEPFSALDPETERGLLDTLLAACADRTLIMITHHLAGIERFDRAVFIEDGRIELDGRPAELMRESPRFRQLVELDRSLTTRQDRSFA